MLEKICGMSCLLTVYYEFFENTLEKDIKERNSNNIIVKNFFIILMIFKVYYSQEELWEFMKELVESELFLY